MPYTECVAQIVLHIADSLPLAHTGDALVDRLPCHVQVPLSLRLVRLTCALLYAGGVMGHARLSCGHLSHRSSWLLLPIIRTIAGCRLPGNELAAGGGSHCLLVSFQVSLHKTPVIDDGWPIIRLAACASMAAISEPSNGRHMRAGDWRQPPRTG